MIENSLLIIFDFHKNVYFIIFIIIIKKKFFLNNYNYLWFSNI